MGHDLYHFSDGPGGPVALLRQTLRLLEQLTPGERLGIRGQSAEPPRPPCEDLHDDCGAWAELDECSANPEFMLDSCALSCGACTATSEEAASMTRDSMLCERNGRTTACCGDDVCDGPETRALCPEDCAAG